MIRRRVAQQQDLEPEHVRIIGTYGRWLEEDWIDDMEYISDSDPIEVESWVNRDE